MIIAYATTQGIDPTPFVLLVGMNMLHQYLLPVSNLPNIIGLATEENHPERTYQDWRCHEYFWRSVYEHHGLHLLDVIRMFAK